MRESNSSKAQDPVRAERYEEVTGLLWGQDYFRKAEERLEEFRDGWCLIDIDIKHFKLYVDWYGADSGRFLLGRIAEVMKSSARSVNGLPGYMGQDKFVIIMPYEPERIEALQEEVQELISEVSPIEGFEPCFGIAIIDDSTDEMAEFFNRAALTADEIKENINTRVRVYDYRLQRQNAREYELLLEFQQAIQRGEITFFLQPQFRVSNHKIVGAEALARWRRGGGEWISPAIFVPILEKHGQVSKLDVFIWESVCKWCRSWLDRGHELVPISVNVSRQDITTMDVPAFLSDLLNRYGLTPDDIHVEITETAYADDFNPVSDAVEKLRRRGFSVLMDDFGSGYSSLSMLRNMKMDVIKLDAQFLRIDKEAETKGISILESIVNMTRNLSTPIIVEGVEDEYQAEYLSDLGCTYMQGFYFADPMSVERFEELIGDSRKVDDRGIVFKANQQMRVREFFDESIYSDAILNSILGPVVFYNQKGEDISIIRYNEQFFELTGSTEEQMNQRMEHIQNYMPQEDHRKLLEILDRAAEHPTLGGSGAVRAMKPNGAYVWLEIKAFFLEEDSQGRKFYVSQRDVTETYFLSADMPGAYYRTTTDDDFEFLFISQNFLDLTGYTREEIRIEFDNRMHNMTHPADRQMVRDWAHELLAGRGRELQPYRIRRKRGDYIYIAERDAVTDRFGEPCFQSMCIDVTDVMAMRNQMRILSEHLSDTILFARTIGDRLEFEAVIYNLEDALDMDATAFEEGINNGSFFELIHGYDEITTKGGLSRNEFIRWYLEEVAGGRKALTATLSSGEQIRLAVRADRVRDRSTRVDYIVMMRAL